jgi:hypothetical protein
LFGLGVSAYDRGVYFEALRHFQAAYQLRPHPLVRVNIANCFEKLDRPAEAILNFELFLESGAGNPSQQQEVRDALVQLKKRVGRLVLNVSPEGAKIVIDDQIERRAPMSDAVTLKAGRHQVAISLAGHETALRVVDVTAESTTELTLSLAATGAPPAELALVPTPTATTPPPAELPPAPTPPPADPTPQTLPDNSSLSAPWIDAPMPPSSPPGRTIPAVVWLTGGATFVALMGSIVTGQLALSADREFNGDLAAVRNMSLSDAQRASAWAQGIDAAERAGSFAVATDVLLSISLAGAVLTTIFYFDQATSSGSEDAEIVQVRTPAITAVISQSSAALELHSRF